jgi:replicative DNA helicase
MIPHSIEAEQSVIGGLMLDTGSERCQTVMSMLKPETFFNRAHQVIFAEMRELITKQHPIDLVTLFESLEAKSLSDIAGGFAYLAEMSNNTPSSANIVHYAMVVREKAMERYGIDKLTSATELLYTRNGMSTAQKFEAIHTLFTEITDRDECSLVCITHDIAVVNQVAERVLVFADGQIIEQGSVREILERPTHEVTRALIAAAGGEAA